MENKPNLILLDTQEVFNEFYLTIQPLNITFPDIIEITWQILMELEDLTDNLLEYKLRHLPDYETLLSKHILDNDVHERILKLAVKKYAMGIHKQIWSLGLYDDDQSGDTGLQYKLEKIVNGKLALVRIG